MIYRTRENRGPRRGRIVAVVAALALALATPSSAAPAPETAAQTPELDDPAIADTIESEILYDPAVPFDEIEVAVTDGVVRLGGTVDSLLARERATRLALAVKGVRSVVNEVEVEPATMIRDQALAADVREALLDDAASDAYELDVSVDDGTVTLEGRVDSWQEKQLAAEVAKGVRGVRDLDNRVEIRWERDRPDTEIEAEVRRALRSDVLVDGGLVDVSVENGEVTLTGTLGSASERMHARADAWVAGVREVDDSGIEVARWARDPDLRADKYVARSDAEIRASVEDALLYDPRVSPFDISTSVDAGVVTLRGVVDNLSSKRAAASDARNTVGVIDVRNRIRIHGVETMTETSVEDAVRRSLARDPYVERDEVAVEVDRGVVTLDGVVDTYFDKVRAEEVASRATGVIQVNNSLEVSMAEEPLTYDPWVDTYYMYDFDWLSPRRPATDKSDAEIREDIRDELWWSPFVDEDDVNIVVDDGIATLTGTVDSWSERASATENAYEGGAMWVDNDIVVQTSD